MTCKHITTPSGGERVQASHSAPDGEAPRAPPATMPHAQVGVACSGPHAHAVLQLTENINSPTIHSVIKNLSNSI